MPWLFDHCHACAENDEGTHGYDPGVGCPAEGPGADGCEALWTWLPEPGQETPPNDRNLKNRARLA